MERTRVLVLGGVTFNTMIYLPAFPPPQPHTLFSGPFNETVGEAGAGKALNLGKLGPDVTFHTFVGDDLYGQRIRAALDREPLRVVYEIDPRGTTRHVNLMDAEGRRISIIGVPAGTPPAPDLARIAPLIAASDCVVLDLADYCRMFIAPAQGQQKPIWCDIHDYDGHNPYHADFIAAADYLFLSSDLLPDYRPFMAAQIALGKRLVVCTHGKDGATALTPDGQWYDVHIIPAYPRRDTNGAGDAFFSGVLAAHVAGRTIVECLRIGTIVAGLCITSPELALPELSMELVAREYARYYGDRDTAGHE